VINQIIKETTSLSFRVTPPVTDKDGAQVQSPNRATIRQRAVRDKASMTRTDKPDEK
jgi:hypothetical protein